MVKQQILSKINLVLLCLLLILVLITQSTSMASTGSEMKIIHTQLSGEIVVYTAGELYNLLRNPSIPQRREFESEQQYKDRIAGRRKEIEHLKNSTFTVEVPLSCVLIEQYDMQQKGFPLEVQAFKWKYVSYQDSFHGGGEKLKGTIYKIGLTAFDSSCPRLRSFIYVPIEEAKLFREDYSRLKVRIRNVKATYAYGAFNYIHHQRDTRKKWHTNVYPWTGIEPKSHVPFKNAKCYLEILIFEVRSNRHSFEFSLGEKKWYAKSWTFYPTIR